MADRIPEMTRADPLALVRVRSAWLWSILAASAANAILFAYTTATPLLANDSWYFLESFIREYYAWELDLRDFFDKRSVEDHAQPVHRFILLLHLRWFDLDFKVEALVGVSFAIASALGAMRLAGWGLSPPEMPTPPSAAQVVLLAAIPALALSLNSPEVFSWSLATLGYMLIGLALVLFSIGAGVLAGRRPAWHLALVSFLTALALDNLALAFASAFVALSLTVAIVGGPRSAPMRAALACLAGTAAYDAVLQPLLTQVDLPTSLKPDVLAYVGAHWNEAWKVIWLPAQSVLVSPLQTEGSSRLLDTAAMLLPVLLLAAHALYWARAVPGLRSRRIIELTCAGLALAFYAVIAAITVGRVPLFNFDYLAQPRYFVAFLLGCLPILIAAVRSWRAPSTGRVQRTFEYTTLALAAGVLLVQLPISANSWARAKYISEYTQVAAFQMGALKSRPSEVNTCVDILKVCEYDTARKQAAIALLADNNLNIFNRAFQLRYRLYPQPQDVPAIELQQADQANASATAAPGVPITD